MLFRKKKISVYPKVRIRDIDLHYRCEDPEWSFEYKDIGFVSYTAQFILPSLEELDRILDDVENLREDMLNRCRSYWKDHEHASDGELLLIDLEHYSSDSVVRVSWCGNDDSWGDMGVDFVIKNSKVEGESWGD